MTEVPEKPASRFWTRPDILAAQKACDVWATVAWHYALGGDGVPTFDWIRGMDEPRKKIILPDGAIEYEFGIYTEILRQGFVRVNKTRQNPKGDLVFARWIEKARIQPPPATSGEWKLPTPFLIFLGIEDLLEPAPLIRALLLHRYPQFGPCRRSDGERALRKFRPPAFERMVGPFMSRYSQGRLDEWLGGMERDALEAVARVEVRP